MARCIKSKLKILNKKEELKIKDIFKLQFGTSWIDYDNKSIEITNTEGEIYEIKNTKKEYLWAMSMPVSFSMLKAAFMMYSDYRFVELGIVVLWSYFEKKSIRRFAIVLYDDELDTTPDAGKENNILYLEAVRFVKAIEKIAKSNDYFLTT